jgi:hypothetical protein
MIYGNTYRSISEVLYIDFNQNMAKGHACKFVIILRKDVLKVTKTCRFPHSSSAVFHV